MKKRVILAGGGHAHLAVLADWAMRSLPAECWLVTSARRTAYSGMLPGWLAGMYRAADLLIDLKPLAEEAGARLVLADVVGLDPVRQMLDLSTGETVAFDLLSLATGGEIDVSSLATLGDRLLPVRPVDAFMGQWSNFLEAQATASEPHVAVVGGGAAGVELALAVGASFSRLFAHAHVSLVTPEHGFLSGHASAVRRQALAELSKRGIPVHFAEAAGDADGLLLSNGSHLPVDCAIAATGSRAPRWLTRSGLARGNGDFVAVGPDMRSTSHPFIFAAGDIIDRVDRDLPRSGVHAVKAGPVLAANLRAVLCGEPLRHYTPRTRTLYILATGDRRAILSWGKFTSSGSLVWRLKDRIDRYFVNRYRRTVEEVAPQ